MSKDSDSGCCVFCGEEKPSNQLRPDPYMSEVENDEEEMIICDECWINRKEQV